MKRIFSSLVSLLLIAPLYASAANAPLAKFTVTVPTTARVGEAIDVTVTAVDSNNETKKDYNGTIFISVDDTKATVPYSNDGYAFVNADQGTKTFSKGLIFSKEGKMKLTIIDLDQENIEGSATIDVTAGQTAGTGSSETITISSPTDGTIISDTTITVTGNTKKNSKVKLFLNTVESASVQTGDDGGFTATLSGISQKENVLRATVYNGNDTVIGESKTVNFTLQNEGPAFKGITFAEGKNVPEGTVLTTEITAESWLKEVSATLGASNVVFKEAKDGKYTGSLTAPTASGSYPVSVRLVNDLGKTTVRDNAETIIVTTIDRNFNTIKIEPDSKARKVSLTFSLTGEPVETAKFKIEYTTDSGAFDTDASGVTSVTTYEKSKIRVGTGSTYKWFIPNLDPAKYYFRFSCLDASGAQITDPISSVVESELVLDSAGKTCTISNISGLKTTKQKDSTLLTWDAVPEATSYNVYKKAADGSFSLIENVKDNRYTIHITRNDAVVYDDFSIKGLCGNKDAESANFSETTKVQTGPAQVLLVLLLSLGIGYFVTRRNLAFVRGK